MGLAYKHSNSARLNGMHFADSNYEDLANAIVVQAAEDYRDAIRFIRNHPKETLEKIVELQRWKRDILIEMKQPLGELHHLTQEEKEYEAILAQETIRDECAEFFLSSWFEILTNLNGEVFFKKLKEECRS